MKWLRALFGQPSVPKSRLEPLFALASAQVTLEVTFGLRPTGQAAVVFRTVESSYFEATRQEVEQLLQITIKESGTRWQQRRDALGFHWLVLEDEQLEDLVAAAHMVGQTLQEHGFGDRLLAAIFAFRSPDDQQVYWIYNYKRGTFYPFVPLPGQRARNRAMELRLAAVLQRELPVEPEQERWYPLWDAPL